MRFKKTGRSSTMISGPRECNTKTPVLLSHKGENCSDSGVACVAGGSGPWEGIAHIGGRPICEDGWDAADAKVFCRQMGFRDQDSHRFAGDRFGDASGPFGMNELQCVGTERSVTDCQPKTPARTCLQWEGARVRCQRFNDVEARSSSTARPTSLVCGDCMDICLKGGNSCNEGNVYIRYQPVCDDDWDIQDADVVCRQLNYPGAKNFTNQENSFEKKTFYIEGDNFVMDDVQCKGNEARLQECKHSSSHDCDLTEAAGVICHPRNESTSTRSNESPYSCEVTVASGDWALSGENEQFHMRNVLYDACDHADFFDPPNATYWLAPADTNASFVLDLGCSRVVDGFTLKNTRNAHHNDRGLKRFSIALSNSTDGPWQTVLEESLLDARNSSCNVPLSLFSIALNHSEEVRTAKAIKLQVISWFGEGAGLQYLDIHYQQPDHLVAVGMTVGITILAIVLLLLLFSAIWKREAIGTRLAIFKKKRLNKLLKRELRDESNAIVKYELQ